MTRNQDSQFSDASISRREFVRLTTATAGALALPGNATASLSSSKMTKRYEYVVNHTAADYEVPTLVEFTDDSGFTELDLLNIKYRATTHPKPAAHVRVKTAEIGDILDIGAAERLSYSPGSNPFWRLGQYPNGVFPEATESTDFIDYEQMVDGLDYLASEHSNRLSVYSIGESPGHYNYVNGEVDRKDVLVAEVTNDIDDEAAFREKEKVMYSLSLHGLERAGAEAGSRFIEDLLVGEEPETDALLDDIVLIFVYPNPDGWVAKHPQYESGWQVNGPEGGAPVIPFYERGNAEVFDTNRQYPTVGWIDPANYPGESMGSNLVDDEPGVDADVPDAIREHTPDALSIVEHFREYENLNYGADLHGMLWSAEFILGLISQHQFDHGQLHELYQMNRAIDEVVEAELGEWNQLAEVQQALTGDLNPEALGFNTLPEQAFDYSAIWDTIGYTVTGVMADWMAHPEELGGLGMTTMDFEMAYTHMVGANAYNPKLVDMQVSGYTTAIRTLADYTVQQTTSSVETGGKSTAYVTTDSLTRSSDDLSFVQEPGTGFIEMDTGESFSGTIGPGTPNARTTERHTFTAPADALKIEASLSWTPTGQDLEFYLEDADGNRIGSAQTTNNPEHIAADIEGGAEYTFVVETWLNAAAQYEISATYMAYGEKSTETDEQTESVVIGPNDLTEFYASVREETDSLSVHVHVQPNTLHRARLKNPSGDVVREFDAPADADRYNGMEAWTVDDPDAGEWTVEAQNLMDAKEGEVSVTFSTLASNEVHPNPNFALGYEQREYEVSPFAFFDEYGEFADAPVDALTVADVTAGAHLEYDNLVVIHDDSITDTEYVGALDEFVDTGGNLVLTDTGIRLLAPMENEFAAGISSEDVSSEQFYIAHLEQKYPGHGLLQDTRPIQSELWKIAPLGYSTSNQAPMTLVDADAFDAAGGTVAGETDGMVAAGSLIPDLDTGTGIHVIGGLLPPVKQTNLHPFGMLDYAVAFFGHTVLTNALGYQQNRYVNGELVDTFGDTGSFSVESSVTAERSNDGDLFTGGEQNEISIAVAGNTEALVRDQMPAEWSIVDGDSYTTDSSGDVRYVEFEEPVEDGTRSYVTEAPDDLAETNTYEFGPVEYSLDGGDTWTEIPSTTDRNNVLAADTTL